MEKARTRSLLRTVRHRPAALALLGLGLVLLGWWINSLWGSFSPVAAPAGGAFAAPPPRPGPPPLVAGQRPRNLILVIGDGMGLGMLSSSSALLHGPAGGPGLEQAPVVGLVRTYASDALETDSAAAGTALATGHKTRRTMVSVLPDGSEPLTLLEAGQACGMATGVVTTSGLMDATPACFTAHDPSRKNKAEILADQLRSGTSVLIGAAWGHLSELEQDGELAAAAAEARAAGCTIVTTAAELATASAPLLALLPPRPGSPEAAAPPLPDLVEKALAELRDDEHGFLLIVESEETDAWGHDNSISRVLTAVKELEQAIDLVLAFAEQQGDTLVLITADHDTGGLGIGEGKLDGSGRPTAAEVSWNTDSHLVSWVPIFAFGPGAEHFGGVMDNTEIPYRLGKLLQLPGFPTPRATGAAEGTCLIRSRCTG